MYASMRGLAVMLSVVQSALNTEELAAGTFQLAQLHIALQVYCGTFKLSHKVINAGLPALEPSDVRRYPLVNVGDAQIDQVVDVSSQILNPNIIRDVLARVIVSPRTRQGLQSSLTERR